jgi:hypothetical protein
MSQLAIIVNCSVNKHMHYAKRKVYKLFLDIQHTI